MGNWRAPSICGEHDVTDKFEEKIKYVIKWDDEEAFKVASNYKSRPTYFMMKLVACEKLSRDPKEKEVADKFAANIIIFEKYMKLALFVKKNVTKHTLA